MAVVVIDTIKPKNNGTFPVVEAADVKVTDSKRLDAALNDKANQSALNALSSTVAGKANQSDLNALSNTVSGKQNALTEEQLGACNSGITSTLVAQISTNTTAIAGKASQSDLNSTNAEVANKADASDITSLQAQIDALVTPVTQDAEVENARVSADGTSYTTLKARLDANENDENARIDAAYRTLSEVDAAFGFDEDVYLKYTSKNVPKPDGTFFTDNYNPQTWFGTGYIQIPSGVKAIRFCGAGHGEGVLITPIAFYDANKDFISCASVSGSSYSQEGIIDVPEGAVYFYQTKYYNASSTANNTNNYTKYNYGAAYNLEYIASTADMVGGQDITYTSAAYTKTDIPLTNGSSIDYGGDNWHSTDYIICTGRTSVNYVARSFFSGTTVDVAYIAFYDENKVMISCLKSSDVQNGEQSGTVSVPAGAKYVRGTRTDDITPKIELSATGIFAQYDFDKIEELSETVGAEKVEYTSSAFTSSAVYLVDGTTREFEGWSSTDFVDCSDRTYVGYVARSFYSGTTVDIAYVAFFNEAKTMVSCLKSSDVQNGEQRGVIAVPAGAKYVRVVTDSVVDPKLVLNATGMTKKVDDMYADFSNNALNISDANIICIGDSLTQGVNGDTTLYPITLITENYPYYLGQALKNNNVKNYARYGATPETWWNRFRDFYDTPTPALDIAVIMLGTNGGISDTLATDVEPYNNYNDYAETSCGCYCKIIEWLKSVTNNHVQIVLMYPPTCNAENPDKYTVVKNSLIAIQHIAERYSVPVIDLFNESGIGILDNATFRPYDGLHFNAKGYHRIGTFVASQLKSLYSKFNLTDTDTEIPPYN